MSRDLSVRKSTKYYLERLDDFDRRIGSCQMQDVVNVLKAHQACKKEALEWLKSSNPTINVKNRLELLRRLR